MPDEAPTTDRARIVAFRRESARAKRDTAATWRRLELKRDEPAAAGFEAAAAALDEAAMASADGAEGRRA